jgi:hypothetical protein
MEMQLQMPAREILNAFESLRSADASANWGPRANAPDWSSAKGWFNQLVTTIDDAIRDIVQRGAAVVDIWIEKVKSQVAKMQQELGEKTTEVLDLVKEKLAAIQRHLCQTAIGLLPQTLTIAGQDVRVREVTVDFAVQLEAGIEASVAWALKTAASGTWTLTAKYGFA